MKPYFAKLLIILAFFIACVELLFTIISFGLYEKLFNEYTYIGYKKVKDSLSIRLLKYSTKFY